MWFWPVNEMIELAVYVWVYVYIYIHLILRTPEMSSRTPGGTRTAGWVPLSMLSTIPIPPLPHTHSELCFYFLLAYTRATASNDSTKRPGTVVDKVGLWPNS